MTAVDNGGGSAGAGKADNDQGANAPTRGGPGWGGGERSGEWAPGPEAQSDAPAEDPADRPRGEDDPPRGGAVQVALADDGAEDEEGCDADHGDGGERKPGS